MQAFTNIETSRTFSDKSTLSRSVKEQARLLGFEKAAIVPAFPLDKEAEQLKEWLTRAYHADMTWMARAIEGRIDPTQVLPGALSVVVVTLNYYTAPKHTDDDATGKVSRYAWGDDYHDVVGGKLRALLSWIKEHSSEVEGKVCVDIQPMMDKAWAVRAGLGWLGKHSNLITKEYGSWVFIGELLLNIELEYDTDQVDDHCGTCTLCIDACPTRAITEPYVVDSNKCISYATIELRAPEMPAEIEDRLSGWLYGCDICQDVCPWNRFEQVSDEKRFEPREGSVNAALLDVLELIPETYVERFRGSAMKRAKLAGLQRNARALLNAVKRNE
jgi:epoxyqueuosine reductase